MLIRREHHVHLLVVSSTIDGTAGESFIANPPEEQILFRFTGVLRESTLLQQHILEKVFYSTSVVLLNCSRSQNNQKSTSEFLVQQLLYVFQIISVLVHYLHYLVQQNPLLQIQKRDNFSSPSLALNRSPSPKSPEIGSGFAKLSGTTSPEILTFAEQPFGTISIFGDPKMHLLHSTLVLVHCSHSMVLQKQLDSIHQKKHHYSSLLENLQKKFIANPPEEGTEIKLSGDATPQILTFAKQPFGVISVFGDAATPRARDFIGSGSLRKLSGAAESITFNPDEKQMLFSFTGASTNKHTESYFGVDTPIRLRRGSLSDFQTYDFQPNWNSSGTVRVFGEAIAVYSPVYFGSGTFRKFSGAAESLTVNPDERQMLFSFTGESTERTSATHVGEGNLFAFSGGARESCICTYSTCRLRLNGQVGIRYVPNNVGFGNIFNIGGSAESSPSTQMKDNYYSPSPVR